MKIKKILVAVAGVAILYITVGYLFTLTKNSEVIISDNFEVKIEIIEENSQCYLKYIISQIGSDSTSKITRLSGKTNSFFQDISVDFLGVPNIFESKTTFDVIYLNEDIEVIKGEPLEKSEFIGPCASVGWNRVTFTFRYSDQNVVVSKKVTLYS